jgi:hypothetical protein
MAIHRRLCDLSARAQHRFALSRAHQCRRDLDHRELTAASLVFATTIGVFALVALLLAVKYLR